MEVNNTLNKNYYIICPGNCGSGGPDALHQLYYYLKQLVSNVYLVYVVGKKQVYPAYKKYNPQIIDFNLIEDKEENILIVPESLTKFLKGFKNIKKIVWWLSVYNYGHTNFMTKLSLFVKSIIFSKSIKELKYAFKRKVSLKKLASINNYVASKYANVFLLSKNIKSSYLIEPLGKDFLDYFTIDVYKNKRENVVLYNPKKGFEITKQIISANPDMTFIPLINYSSLDLIKLMSTAKLYIDFGHFPGPERLPKESALFGCNVLVRKTGASINDFDVNIPNKYKLTDIDISNISKIITNMLENYDSDFEDFNTYRTQILNLESNFIKSINELLISL